jgi:hypothetical protein
MNTFGMIFAAIGAGAILFALTFVSAVAGGLIIVVGIVVAVR